MVTRLRLNKGRGKEGIIRKSYLRAGTLRKGNMYMRDTCDTGRNVGEAQDAEEHGERYRGGTVSSSGEGKTSASSGLWGLWGRAVVESLFLSKGKRGLSHLGGSSTR